MAHNGFTRIDWNQPTTQNEFLIFIQIDPRLKKLPEFWFKSTHNSKNFLESWLKSTHDFIMKFIPSFEWLFGHLTFLLTWYDLFGLSTQVLTSYDLFGISAHRQIDLKQLMTQAVSRRLESSIQLMTQNASQFFDPNRLMTQAKNIWFWVDSWFVSE